ncbi:MAG: 6-phosphogluconolactonase [Planctomycetota bacterium]|jgi:6-phosphogluconolactonase
MIRPAPSKSRKTYGLEKPSLVGPPLPGEVNVAETVDELIDLLAAEMVVQAKLCVRRCGDFHLALSGGSSPQPLYERLMYDPDCRQLPWRHTHLWLVDERRVPADDARSNFRLIKETIVEHSGIPAGNVHPVDSLAENADRDYEARLQRALLSRERDDDRLDFVLLGMGSDGHTASLFPGHDVLYEPRRFVRSVTVPEADPPRRVTMTYPAINAARVIGVLVTGSAKAPTIERVVRGHESFDDLPIKGVRPADGELKWFLDAAACGLGEDDSGVDPS